MALKQLGGGGGTVLITVVPVATEGCAILQRPLWGNILWLSTFVMMKLRLLVLIHSNRGQLNTCTWVRERRHGHNKDEGLGSTGNYCKGVGCASHEKGASDG